MTGGRPEGCDGRRLRFDYDLGLDESVPGALIAALGPQWLDGPRPVLEAAGLQGRRPGTLFLMSPEEARRLAWTIRCDPDRLGARVGRAGAGSSTERRAVTFDGLVLPRGRFETRWRRIAPNALAAGGRHRICWMDRLLPYSIDTLERLVDACSDCGAPLLWAGAARVDGCGRCGVTVRPSPEPPLPEELVADYRSFAALSSPVRDLRIPVLAGLPARLATVPPGTLSRLAFHIGGMLHDPPFESRSPQTWSGRPAVHVARAAATGLQMLREWPEGLRRQSVMAADALRADRAAFERHRARLKRLLAAGEAADIVTLVGEAMPELSRHRSHSFAGSARYYLAKETVRRLGIHASQLQRLRGWPGLRHVVVPSLVRTMGQYDADQIDGLVPVFRDASPVASVAWRLDLPGYAIEQLAWADLLEHEDHAAATAVGRVRTIRDASVDRLCSRLAAVASNKPAPPSAVPIGVAARRFGGGLKPWHAIVAGVLAGDLPMWGWDGDGGLRAAFVDPRQLEEVVVERLVPPLPTGSLPRSDTISQLDAVELLVTDRKNLLGLAQELGFEFSRKGYALVADRGALEDVAGRFASALEVQSHLGGDLREIRTRAGELGIAPIGPGWDREELIRSGLLPPAWTGSRPHDHLQ